MKTHRETYPEQYTHSLVGKLVTIESKVDDALPVQGIVERVVQTRFGPVAKLAGNSDTWWHVSDCKVFERKLGSADIIDALSDKKHWFPDNKVLSQEEKGALEKAMRGISTKFSVNGGSHEK